MTQSLLNRNALFNIVGGFSAMLINIALPPLIARLLPASDFASWMLALQIANYLAILNFGLQMVLAQVVASTEVSGNFQARNAAVSTAFWLVLCVSIIGLGVMAWSTTNTGPIAPALNVVQQENLKHSLMLIAGSFVLWLPVSILLAVFIGQQRNGWYAMAMLISRLMILVAVSISAAVTRDIVWMAFAWLLATGFASLAILLVWYKKVDGAQLSPRLVRLSQMRSLLKGGATLTIWNVVVLLVTGFQVLLVGRHDFASVPVFSGALSVAALLVGISAAVTATLVPHVVQHSHRTGGALPLEDLERVALLGNILTFGGSATLALGGWWFVRLWLGPEFAEGGASVVTLVVVSQAIRNLLSAYSMATIALGLQHKLLIGPLGEGVTAVTLGLLLVPTCGVAGVILAMLIAPFSNILFTLATNPIGRVDPRFKRTRFMLRSTMLPTLPLVAAFLFLAVTHGSMKSELLMLPMSLFVGALYGGWAIYVFRRV